VRASALALAVCAALTLAACGTSSQAGPANGEASFVSRATNAVFFIQWDRDNATLTGYLQTTIQGSPAGSQPQTGTESFTGTISGNGLTLSVGGTSPTTYVGRLRGTGFTLSYPGAAAGTLITLTFTPAGVGAYNSDVTALTDAQYGSPCTLYAVGHDAQVNISGTGAPAACAAFVAAAPTDATWTTDPQSGANDDTTVCTLTSPDGELVAMVADDGDQEYGTEACSTLSGLGWTGGG
jgi:hypothetical protein